MRIVLVSQVYPPYPIVGALRARKLAEAFRAAGHEVQVVTERLPEEGDGLRVSEPGLRVHTVVVGPPYRLRFLSLIARARRGRRSGARTAEPVAAATGSAVVDGSPSTPKRAGFLRRLVLALLWLPDDEQRFIRPALRVARQLLPDVDLVYTTAPPFSTHLVGLLLARRSNVRWVAEFRDPWTDQREELPDRVAAVEAVHRWLERMCLRRADVVVAVTERARQRLAQKVPERQRHKFVLAVNGIDHLVPVTRGRVPGPFRIVYAGTFYHNRDPRSILDALARLRHCRGLTPADLRVDFVGRCRQYDDLSVEAMVTERELGAFVHFHDWMARDEAHAIATDADLLILIALGQPLQVPNKLFDYLGTRRRILAIVDEGGETERMLRQVGGHHIVSVPPGSSVEADAVELAIEAAYDAVLRGCVTVPSSTESERILQEWLSKRQMQRLVEAISA